MNLRKIIRVVECDGQLGWQAFSSGKWRRATGREVADLAESHGLRGRQLDKALKRLLDHPARVPDLGVPEYEQVMRQFSAPRSPDWDLDLWLLFHEMQAYMARRRLQRFLAGRLLPAGLSPAGLEAAYRRAGNEDWIPNSLWSQITQIN